MTAAALSAFEWLMVEWSEAPAVAIIGMGLLLCGAYRLIYQTRIRIVQQQDRQQNAAIALDVAQGHPTAKTRKVQAIVEMSAWRERKGA